MTALVAWLVGGILAATAVAIGVTGWLPPWLRGRVDPRLRASSMLLMLGALLVLWVVSRAHAPGALYVCPAVLGTAALALMVASDRLGRSTRR